MPRKPLMQMELRCSVVGVVLVFNRTPCHAASSGGWGGAPRACSKSIQLSEIDGTPRHRLNSMQRNVKGLIDAGVSFLEGRSRALRSLLYPRCKVGSWTSLRLRAHEFRDLLGRTKW